MTAIRTHVVRAAQCAAATLLTSSELDRLASLADVVDRPLQQVACELAADHNGGHIGFAVAALGGNQWWWVRWAALQRDLVPLDGCDVGVADGATDEECMLPAGHPGPHSYEIRRSKG